MQRRLCSGRGPYSPVFEAAGRGIISRGGTLGGVRLIQLLVILTLGATGMAQELRTAIGFCTLGQTSSDAAPGCDGGTLALAVTGVRSGGTTLGLELSLGGHHNAGATEAVAQLGIDLAANETFGPLGNVVFELSGALRSDGLAQGTLGARGALGPVAARLSIGAHGAPRAVFDPLASAADDLANFGQPGFSTSYRLGLTGRPSRNVILEADPELYLTNSGAAGRLAMRLRLLRTIGDNELRLLLRGGTTPGFAAAYWSLGAGVLFPRGRAPDITVGVHVGVADSKVSPGVTIDLSENLPGGLRLGLDAALEPYRRDVHPGRVAADFSLPLGTGRMELALAGAFLDARRPSALVLRTSFVTPLSLPGRP